MKTHAMRDRILSAFLAILSLAWVYPVVMILLNSLKKETAITTGTAFEIPTAETFGGLENYMNAIQSQGFPAAFWNTLVITLTSVVLILICCSMCAWVYYPGENLVFQGTLLSLCILHGSPVPDGDVYPVLHSQPAEFGHAVQYRIIYLGFGAGLAVFMFCGFMKPSPLRWRKPR